MAKQTAGDPADLRLVVAFLRSLRRWTQEELSRVSGVDRGVISDYELGAKAPTRKTLQRLTAAVGLSYRFVEILLPLFRASRLSLETRDSSAPEPEAFVPGLMEGLDQAILDAVLPRLAPHLVELEELGRSEG